MSYLCYTCDKTSLILNIFEYYNERFLQVLTFVSNTFKFNFNEYFDFYLIRSNKIIPYPFVFNENLLYKKKLARRCDCDRIWKSASENSGSCGNVNFLK